MSPAPLLRHSSAALLRRLAATTVAAGLVVVGLPAVALAADGTVTIDSTNGLAGVTSASNTATVTVALTTSSTFVYNQQAPANNLTVVVSRAGTSGEDAIEASVTSAASSPPVPGQANSFVVSVDLASANPGAYDVTVSGSTVTVPVQTDRCLSCFTVLSPAPQVTSVSPTTIARTGATTLTVQGLNFARGNYSDPDPNSNYACAGCAGAPKLEVRAHGASVADPGITLSDPPSGTTTVAVPATSTSMAKYVTVAESAVVGAHDIYVENGDGQGVTLQNALTIAPAMTITGVSPATRGQASSGGQITITGTDFPTGLTGAILDGSAADAKISASFVRDSATQLRFTNVAVAADAATRQRTILITSPNTFDTVTSTAFSITAAPVADSYSLPDSKVAKYGQGAVGVRVRVTGSGFTPGNGAAGAQIAFTPSTGITVVTQSATALEVTAYVNIAPSATVGTGPELTVVNPDGGTDACSTACRMAISAAPSITGVSPASGGRGQSQTVVLTGTNLADGTVKSAPTVTFTNATNGAATATSATSVSVASVQASSTVTGAQDISIINNDDKGRSTSTGAFTITNLSVTGTTNGSSLNNGAVLATATGHGFDPAATVSLVKTGAGSATVPAIPGVVTVAPVASGPGKADGTSIQAQFDLTGKDPGTYAFQVVNPGGTPYPGVGQGGLFTVVAAAPTVSSVSPSSRGAGATAQTVVITGTGFGPGVSVAFSNAAVHVDSFTRNSATQLTLVVHVDQGAAADTSGTVTVTNTDAQSVVKPFSVLTGPQITSVSPTSRGQGAADTTLTVTGAQGTFPATANASLTFVNGSGVTASGVVVTTGQPGPVPLASPDALSATVTVAPSATVGSYDVVLLDTSTGGRWVQTNGFTVHAKPTLTSVTPGSGAVGTSVNVTLAGTGFQGSPTSVPAVAATDGVTVSNVSWTSGESVTATFAIPANAVPGTDVDVTLTNADGGFVTLVDAFHLFGKPGAPTIGTATPGDTKATVAWTAPASDGGSPVTSYTVTAAPGGATATVAAPATQADVAGLTNGTAYTFTVHATNAAGNGSESAATSPAVTPRTVPGMPTAVTATGGDKSATVSWTAPVSNGGSAVTSYTVTSAPGGLTKTVAADQRSAVVTGLTNGVAYTFTVVATNVAGDSAASGPSAAVTPVSNATAPSQVEATPGDTEATVTWVAPDDDGGSTITSYVVTSTPGGLTETVAGDQLSAVVTGLSNGTAYRFTVRADNGIPGNPESAPSNAVTPRAVPGVPTGVTGTAGDRSVDVSWTAPADNGATITSYTVTTVQGGATTEVTGDPAATQVTVTGLTNGTPYTFTVHATNSAGDGAESVASAAVTPVTEPGAPTAVSATAGNAEATVSWTAPASNGGSVITSYTATSSPGGKTCSTSGATSCTVTGLTQGSTYTFTVRATNAKGPGPASAASAPVTLSLPPDAPTNVSATAGDGQATLTWTAPSSNGGSTVTSYTVTASPGGASATVTGNPAPTTAAITGLTNGTAYTFAVVARNVAGASAPGTSSAVTPSTKPGAPTSVAATAGDGTVKVTWAAPASDGGASVGFYLVKLNSGSPVVVDGTTRSVAFNGLTNGTSYTATVTAQNSRGNGSAASATPVTPRYVVTATVARSTSAVTYGGAVTLSGKLTRSTGSAMAGKAVRVYAKTYPATTYRLLTTRTTGSTGTWSYSTKPTRYTTYYALFSGDSAHQARKSAAIAVAVRFKVTVTSPAAGATVRAGTVTFRATVAPAISGASGYLVQKRSDGRIVYLAKATVSSKGTWVLSRRLGRGTYTFAVQVNGYKGCATKRTAFFKLKVV